MNPDLKVAFTIALAAAAFCQQIDRQSNAQPPSLQYLADPAVPMISLPSNFRSRRSNSDRRIPGDGVATIAQLKGPGCVRHLWLLPGDDVRLVVHVDGASQPQIDVPLKPFFGVMHDLAPYFIDCAAYSVLPNPAKGVPGTPGYNLYLPIPFAKSCHIKLVGNEGERAVAMTDWHAYEGSATITPYRLHVEHKRLQPSPKRGGFVEMANIGGQGFIAGLAVGYIQKNFTDMVFHTGGTTFLIDGETDPYVIRGHNVEDDFGFTWGFNDRQTRWAGCPYHVNRGRLDQDGVFYRFYGPDPIAFRSSLIFRTGSRGDDMESVVYYYRIPNTGPPEIQTPDSWQVAGLFPNANHWESFRNSSFVEQLPRGKWPVQLAGASHEVSVASLDATRGWIDLQHVYFERHHSATPLTVVNNAAYLRANIQSSASHLAELRLALDDWAIIWMNREKVATIRNEDSIHTHRIPVELQEGNNELLIKTNNRDTPLNKRMWAIHCSVTSSQQSSLTLPKRQTADGHK